jgi:CHAD domain-containing protein
MKQEKIRAVIKDRINEIGALGEKIGNGFDKDTIHEFRVGTKTLRSFLRLLRMHAPQRGLKLTHKFKRLYQIAGAIRDAQLELEKIQSGKTALPEYTRKIMYILDTQKKEWHKRYNKKIVRKMKDRLSSLKYEQLRPEILENFFNAKLSAIEMISRSKSPTDDQVHRMRKEAKDILYTSKLAKKEWKGAEANLKILFTKKLDSFTTAVGVYNDQRISVEHFNSFSSPDMGKSESKSIKKISTSEKEKLAAEKKNILDQAKDLIESMKR